jgi:hypothetical protein
MRSASFCLEQPAAAVEPAPHTPAAAPGTALMAGPRDDIADDWEEVEAVPPAAFAAVFLVVATVMDFCGDAELLAMRGVCAFWAAPALCHWPLLIATCKRIDDRAAGVDTFAVLPLVRPPLHQLRLEIEREDDYDALPRAWLLEHDLPARQVVAAEECERYDVIAGGYSKEARLPGDPPGWRQLNGAAVAALPAGLADVAVDAGWAIDGSWAPLVSAKTDSEGWQFAASYALGRFGPGRRIAAVRRRRWQCMTARDADGMGSAQPSGASAATQGHAVVAADAPVSC